MTVSYAHLLIVDADEQRRENLCIPLQQRQMVTISQAADAAAALVILENEPVDVLLVDAALAASGGYEFIRAVRAADTAHWLSILLLAPAGSEEWVLGGLAAGANDWLYVPADPALLKLRSDLALRQIHLQQQLSSSVENFNEIMALAKNLREKILPLGIALAGETQFNRLLEKIVREAQAICHADGGALFLLTADNQLRLAVAHYQSLPFDWQSIQDQGYPFMQIPLDDGPVEETNRPDVPGYVALTGQSVNIPDMGESDAFRFDVLAAFDAASGYETRSLLCVALRNEGVQGVLLLMNTQEQETGRIIPFSRFHTLVVESLAAQAGVLIHNHALREHTARLRLLQEELRIGRQIQSGFFPAELPQPAGWELAAHLRPAREVSGDFYDVFPLPDGRVGLAVADVVGKGVGAALFMALVRTLVRSTIERDVQDGWNGPAPSAVPALARTVAFTNHYLMAHHAQDYMFATLFIGLVDPQTGELSYVNAGHVPPLLFHGGEERPTRLSRSGPAMGLVQEAEYRLQQETIAPGDWLLIYTDGVTDARNPAGESFGQARLEQVLAQEPAGAQQLLQEIDGRIAAFSQQEEPWDDVTMLALRRLL